MATTSELRALTTGELNQKLQEAYQELMNLRFRLSAKQLEDTSRVRVVRRQVARLKTIKRDRELRAGGAE